MLRLVPTDPPPIDDPDDGTLGGTFASLHAEVARLCQLPGAPFDLGAVAMRLHDLALDYADVPLPDPTEKA